LAVPDRLFDGVPDNQCEQADLDYPHHYTEQHLEQF
jgi:hypothetical protein